MDEVSDLRREIAKKEAELASLRSQLALAEATQRDGFPDSTSSSRKRPLEQFEYDRYSRQMIVPNIGLEGQLRLRKAKVLLVGAGGLGCPAAAYLAGSGVHTLGLVDGDHVEISNLHRQIAHATDRVGVPKVESAITYLKALNPTIHYQAHAEHLTTSNAAAIVSQYDLVLDCTDHPTSRYLISDICVLLSKPLVSASAFQTSGQLIVLNSPPGRGPCYRCIFPKAPPPESVVGCGEGGILGPVVGVMGVLQAMEAIKLIVRGGLEGDPPNAQDDKATMLLFGGMDAQPFRTVRMRGRRKDCFACGDQPSLTREFLESSMDYVQFCGVAKPVSLLGAADRISASEYALLREEKRRHLLLDVREKEHFDLCSLDGAINVPIGRFTSHRSEGIPDWLPEGVRDESMPIYLICRVGNDSQIAGQKLKEMGLDGGEAREIKDIKGGLVSWKSGIDPSLPYV